MEMIRQLSAPGADIPSADMNGVALARIIDPQPLVQTGRNWTRLAGPFVSLLILGAVLWQLRFLNFREIGALIPTSLAFWTVFALNYLIAPFSEWVIFRRLWHLPFSGMAALLRKFVSNEILLGYLGEVYFYAWARRHAKMAATPFGAIKDVTILSALTGNAATLLMVLLAAPMIGQLHLGMDSRTFALSMSVMLGTSILLLLLRKTVFSLPARDLWFVTAVHLARIFGAAALTGLLWHLVLPQIALSYWLLLSTMRQLLSRLPLVPNKDVMFVGIASLLVGRDMEIVSLLALIATLTLLAHVLVGVVFGISGLLEEKTRKS